ncbi:hypothetical protein LCGC14_0363010 [marine sediment metagenome]|uniref:Uncharacterized protein n=1 Tax=marine sediment metagenome TaxID=412755 RepID=A0A0F9T7B1_9ZZZZ
MNKKQIMILILISLLFFGTRLYKLESFPHYFNDESFYHQLSLNIKEGRFYQGINQKWYVDIYGLKYIPNEHPPLHFLLTIPFLNESIISIRAINVFWNFIIMLLIFFILQKLINTNVGLLGAGIWTVYPFAIYMNRLNFPQTSLALFTLTFILATLYNKRYLSILSVVAATLSQYCGILLVVPFIIKYKRKSYAPLALAAVIGMLYSAWAIDSYVIQQFTPTIERFVYLWPITIVFLCIVGIIWITKIKGGFDIINDWVNWLKIKLNKIYPLYWISLYIYLIVYYLAIRPLDIYAWYTYGLNIFFIGIVGLFLIKDKTLLYSFLMLQAFMLILNRGDHVSMIVQPLVIIGFTILTYRIINILSRYQSFKFWKLDIEPKTDFIWLLGIVAIICLFKVNAYIPHDSEDLDAFYSVLNYTNSIITNETCVMTMTKFSTRLNTSCKSDILLPCAYVHSDCIYRHFKDRTIFNYNISYYNMKYVVVKESGLEFLKQWGKKNNASMFATADTIMNWENTTINNITVFINPATNLTYGKFGYHRVYYREPVAEGEAIINILNRNKTNVSDYSVYEGS